MGNYCIWFSSEDELIPSFGEWSLLQWFRNSKSLFWCACSSICVWFLISWPSQNYINLTLSTFESMEISDHLFREGTLGVWGVLDLFSLQLVLYFANLLIRYCCLFDQVWVMTLAVTVTFISMLIMLFLLWEFVCFVILWNLAISFCWIRYE